MPRSVPVTPAWSPPWATRFLDPSSRRLALTLFLLLTLAGCRVLWTQYWRGDLLSIRSPLFYNAATLAFNYFELGAVRRGLGGSIVYLLSRNPLLGTALFHAISAAAVSLSMTWLILRLGAPWQRRTVFVMMAAFMMHFWGEDSGRIDIAVAAMLGAATVAMLKGRSALAAVIVGTGLLLHETSFIYGVPLLAALGWRHKGGPAGILREHRAALAILALALAVYVALPLLPHADLPTMIRTVQAKFPPRHQPANLAIYFAVSGARGLRTSICANLTDPTYWMHPLSGLIVLAVGCAALAPQPTRAWPAVILAAVPPLAFLCAVANDGGRWAMLSMFNAWLVLVASPAAAPRDPAPHRIWHAPVCALTFLILTTPLTVRMQNSISTGSPLLQKLVDNWTGTVQYPSKVVMRRCDPDWYAWLSHPSGR